MNSTKSRLESIAKRQGYKAGLSVPLFLHQISAMVTPYYPYASFLPRMSFHFTEGKCYLSADLFYVEVLLLPCGEVEEVKVVPHGESPVVSGLFYQAI